MKSDTVSMAALELQDVTHQLVQHFMAELEDMLDDLLAGVLTETQTKLLDKIIDFFEQEMAQHHVEEESRIFPRLLAHGDATLTQTVQLLKADHEQLREGWGALRSCLLQLMGRHSVEAPVLYGAMNHYSECFARHLVREESVQFSPVYRSIFQRWDA